MALAVRRLEDGLAVVNSTGTGEALIIQAAAPQLNEQALAAVLSAAERQLIVLGGRADRLHSTIASACGIHLDPPPVRFYQHNS